MLKKNKNDEQNMTTTTRAIENKTIHCKSIIDGLLYDTLTSELLCKSGGCAYFKTKNGRYFCCDYENFSDTYYDVCEDRWRYGFQEIYASISPISEMSVIRVHKNKNFTVMSNTHLRDKNLSLKAKGLLSVMLSLPDDWDYSIAGLCSICKENETAVKSAINELKANRYVIVIREEPTKENGGRIKYNYEVYEEPQGEKQDSEKQGIEILGVEFQGVENQGQINTNISNTDKLNTDNKNHALFFDKNKGRVHACFAPKQGASPSYSDKQLEERLTGVISEYAYDVENANMIFYIFMYFYKEYELRFGRKHPILSDMTYEKIIKSYYEPVGDEISNTDIDINEHRKMVDLYFDTDYNKRCNYNGEIDKSLQHFFSGQIRNHLLMRVRDVEDYV